ncbi:MAG: hypothetical protein EHM37_01965 [Deltaproteobacteria bacterium]|nr:MAG: hypothetical protein EHM37_01965 [Deltaproteobacteria bacterium]
MKHTKALIVAPALSLIMLGNVGAADSPMSLRPIFGDFHATAGNEVAVPFFKSTDSNGDGYPESIKVSFRVYSAGTNTLLHTTPAMKLLTAPIPTGCTVNDPNKFFDFDWDILPTRRIAQLDSSGALVAENKRMSMAINLTVDCWDGSSNQYSERAAVYSGNLSGVAETGNPVESWMRVFNGRQIYGLNGVDQDGNLINDALMITTGMETSLGDNITVYFVVAGTGIDLGTLPASTYALTR